MSDSLPLRPVPPDDEADLADLAGGRLDRRRAAALEARAAADRDLGAALEAQRIAVRAIRAANAVTAAPAGLRARIEALPSTAPPPRKVRPGRRRRAPGLVRAALGLGGAAAASLVLALALLLSGGGPAPEDALAFAARPATAEARPDPATPQLLRESAGGVRFPDFAGFGWRAVGTRTDALDGRRTRTVFYARGGRRIAYTIVGGEPLRVPDDAEPVARDGVRLHVLGSGPGRAAVTWRRGGRTCVLSGDAVSARALLELAAWEGKGVVRF